MTTQTLTAAYDASTFDQIPHLTPVRIEFEKKKGVEFVNDILGPLIRRHGLEEELGVYLVHKHFDIEPSQKLVEFNNITVPWIVSSEINQPDPKNKSIVYETAWTLNEDDKWMAYEYAYSPTSPVEEANIVNLKDHKYQAFLADFTAVLKEHGFDKLLGVRAWPGKGFEGGLEFTNGQANIFLKPGQFSRQTDGSIGYTNTMWFWAKEFVNKRGECVCGWRNGWHLAHDEV